MLRHPDLGLCKARREKNGFREVKRNFVCTGEMENELMPEHKITLTNAVCYPQKSVHVKTYVTDPWVTQFTAQKNGICRNLEGRSSFSLNLIFHSYVFQPDSSGKQRLIKFFQTLFWGHKYVVKKVYCTDFAVHKIKTTTGHEFLMPKHQLFDGVQNDKVTKSITIEQFNKKVGSNVYILC